MISIWNHQKANLPLGGLEKEKCFLKVSEGTRYKLFIQTGTTFGAGTDSVGKNFKLKIYILDIILTIAYHMQHISKGI